MLDKIAGLCYNVYVIKKGRNKTMSEYRKNLVDRMIHLYGFEHEIVILFANMAEKYTDSKEWDNAMRLIVEAHEANPVIDED